MRVLRCPWSGERDRERVRRWRSDGMVVVVLCLLFGGVEKKVGGDGGRCMMQHGVDQEKLGTSSTKEHSQTLGIIFFIWVYMVT